MREAELKFAVAEDFRLPEMEGLPGGVEASSPEEHDLETVYYDTADLRLTRWGCSLRHRNGEGWTVKLPAGSDGDLLVRHELPIPGGPSTPPSRALDLLTAYLRASPVAPVARLRTRRRQLDLRNGTGALVAQVMDDDVAVVDPDGEPARFREIEVEVQEAGSSRLVNTVRKRLEGDGAAPSAAPSKLVVALGDRAHGPPDVDPPSLRTNATAADAIRATVGKSARRLITHDAGVRLGHDPEDVHQARVAVRRLRSDLATFRDLLEGGWGDDMRDDLRRLGRELGEVRDTEVLSEWVDRTGGELGEEETSAIAQLRRRLDRQREEARERLLASMRAESYVALLDRLVAAAREPAVKAEASRPGSKTLPPLLEAAWERLARAVQRADEDASDERLHRVRIRAKRFRYAAEAVAPVLGKKIRAAARAAEKLQDTLGSLQDAVTAEKWLRAATADGGPAFAAGALTVLLREQARDARRRWPRVWKTLEKKAPA